MDEESFNEWLPTYPSDPKEYIYKKKAKEERIKIVHSSSEKLYYLKNNNTEFEILLTDSIVQKR